MSIQYDLSLNKLTTPASYAPRVRPRATTDTAALAAAIASTSSQSVADVQAVLISLAAQVQTQLLAGNQVQIDGLGIISATLRGRVPGPTDPLPDDATIEVGYRADNPLRKALQTQGQLERVDPENLAPLLLVLEAETGAGLLSLAAGDVLRLSGDRLKVNVAAADEGAFLISDVGTANRVTNYLSNGDKELLFAVPATLNASTTYTLWVRNRRKGSIALRSSAWPTPVVAAP